MKIISIAYSLISIKMSKIEEKRKKSIAIRRFLMGFKIYSASLGPILMAASLVRGTTLMP